MKKVLLLFAALIIAAGAMAQNTGCNVYSAGVNPDPNSGQYVGIYMNNSAKNYYSPESSSTYKAFPEAFVSTGQGNGYILAYDLLSTGGNYRSTRIKRNDNFVSATSATTIYTLDETSDPYYYHIEAADFYNDTAYYLIDGYNENWYAYIMKGESLISIADLNDLYASSNGHTTVINHGNAIKVDPKGNIYVASRHYLWKGGTDYSESGYWCHLNKFVPSSSGYTCTTVCVPEADAIIWDIDFYNGNLYACGTIPNASNSSVYNITVWKWGGSTSSPTTVTLTESDSRVFDMAIEGGFVYITGWEGYSLKTWKYYVESTFHASNFEVAFTTPSTGTRNQLCIDVNSTGVYTGGYDNGMGCVWKNGTKLYDYSSDAQTSTSYLSEVHYLFAKEIFDTPTVRSLPYTENFQMGTTDWRNWIKFDNEDDNGVYNSFWERYYYSGKECVRHRWGSEEQTGNIYSPKIQIPNNAGKKVTLRFKTYEQYPDDLEYGYSSVYVAHGIDDFDENNISCWYDEVWAQTTENASDSWKEVEVDLSAYKGQIISINFDYGGEDAHAWAVTDIEIFEETDGIEEDGESVALNVMPNPANDVIRVNGLNGTEEVNIYNTLGQIVKSARLSDGQDLNISDLSAGVYMLRSEKNAQVVKFTVK